MEKIYFTFENGKTLPYKNTYLIVVGHDLNDGINEFRNKYPDYYPDTLNCSDYYSQEQWESGFNKDYKNQEPTEIIFTNNCFGNKPEGYDDLFIFVPEMKQIIRIAEGTGANLLQEDEDEGYVDYIYYDQYELCPDMTEVDGGQILLKESFRDKYKCTADCIPDVLCMAYGSYFVDCRILA